MKYFKLFISMVVFIFILGLRVANGADNQLPIGFFDAADCNYFVGWACDESDFAQSSTVNFYADNASDAGGVFIGSTIANIAREQAVGNLCGGNSNRGFGFSVPSWLKDGKSHKIYAYGVNTPAGINPLLPNNQKIIQCGLTHYTIPLLWFAPLPYSSAYDYKGCTDYADLFNSDTLWQNTRKKISVFKMYGLLYNWVNNYDIAKMISKLDQWNIDLALEEGAVKGWGCTAEITANATIADLNRIKDGGGDVKYISLDEPFVGGKESCSQTMDQSLDVTIRYMELVKQNYPDVIIGDIEPYPYFSETQLEEWISGFRVKAGYELPFFQVDINYPRAKLDNNDVVGDLKKLSAFCKSRNIKFSIIAGGATQYYYPTQISNDKDFYDSTLADAQWTLAQIPQDFSIVQSWSDYPKKCLPDSSGYTFSQLAKDFAAIYSVSDIVANSAQSLSQTVPIAPTAGQIYHVSIIMENTGNSTWTAANNFRLGSQNPQDNGTWRNGRVYLAADELIAPGQTKTFTFDIRAPVTAGTYNFQWQMVQDGVEWFGGKTPNVTITVAAAPVRTPVCSTANAKQCSGNGVQTCVMSDDCLKWSTAAACGIGKTCKVGICETACVSKTCAMLGDYQCGNWDDGCGNTLNCGTCSTDQICRSGTCVTQSSGGGGGGGITNPPVEKPTAKMTRAEIIAKINEIVALIAKLQAQLKAMTRSLLQKASTFAKASADKSAYQSKTYSCAQITKILRYGMQNDAEIKCLQEVLKVQGYAVTISGNYDLATKNAVIKFQQKYAKEILTPYGLRYGSGNVGNVTKNKLNQIIGGK